MLTCPLTPWVETENDNADKATTIDAELPQFMKAMSTMKPVLNISQIPGWDCPSCWSSTEQTRTINHTAWNGSPMCAADRSALVDVQTCGFPCKGERVLDPLEAVGFVMEELTLGEWMEKAMEQIIGNPSTLFFERPPESEGNPFNLPYFYVVVVNCDQTKLKQVANGLSGVIADILPHFAKKNKIKVELVDPNYKYCAIKVSFEPLVVSIKDCADSLYKGKVDPVQV